MLLAVMDELAFWNDENTSNPDMEVYNAVLPGLVTVDGMIVAISTPHARRGLLHRMWVKHFGKNSPRVVCIQAETRLLNPTIAQSCDRRGDGRGPRGRKERMGGRVQIRP